ncbi:MAG: hypothetical protein APR63_04660 [Desulfuromonas sp. SDB]|nr:MAG: hypothetical protein APR63_04660 [Desulfuromonas sp. SDB]
MEQIPFVDLKSQYSNIKDEIDLAIQQVVNSAAFVGGPFLKQFEQSFAEFTNRKYAIGVASGTAGLFLTLKALGVRPQDEVIVPALSFIATSEAVSIAGAKIKFVDVREDDLLLDVDKIDFEDHPQVIIPVDLYGKMVYPTDLLEMCIEYEVKLLWDCCQSHGASVYIDENLTQSGSFGTAAVYSFYPGKNLGAYGDGGIVVTDNEILAKHIRKLSDHGREDKYNHSIEGYNERLDGIQASILKAKLSHLSTWNDQRRTAAKIYRERLIPMGIWYQSMSEKDLSAYHLFVIRHPQRDQLKSFLQEKGIATGIHYPIALPHLKAYQHLGYQPGDFPVAEKAAAEILSLPIYPEITAEQVNYICDQIHQFITIQKQTN